ncbi:MAG: chloride channel protein [Myxococcales bacterium]|nr:chloride channel protein [Myxococcales bacterium]
MLRRLARLRAWWRRDSRVLANALAESAPLDLRIVGRTLLHAALVGVAAGIVGALFFGGIELLQRVLLEKLCGYQPLRAHGETFADFLGDPGPYRPWLLVLLPALGGVGCGLVTRLAREAKGGGADTTIEAFHEHRGSLRARVIGVKAIASTLTLATGGSGGREGPTILIGGALGSLVARLLHVSARERRILLVAGTAAGISAVFRTPLGAALLAVEILYRDGFESDALVPSVLASVIAYSVVTSLYGESTLIAVDVRFKFVPALLPLFALQALLLAAAGALFVKIFRAMRGGFSRLPGPEWLRPGLGGLMLGAVAVGVLALAAPHVGGAGQGLGLLGGGYGAVQAVVSGTDWLPTGIGAAGMLLVLALGKMVTSSLTIGSGGSAGDFAPSLAIGAVLGGAFGHAAKSVFPGVAIDPAAFALVGMGTFYGGIAHVPLSALVLVCELAGNYDLLVPLMLSGGIAFIALRKSSLYEAQVPTVQDSPVHRDAALADALRGMHVDQLMRADGSWVSFRPKTPAVEMLRYVEDADWQEVFPVVEDGGGIVGLVSAEALRSLALGGEAISWALAADAMRAAGDLGPGDDLRRAAQLFVSRDLRQLPVIDGGRVVGFLDEAQIAQIYLTAIDRAEAPGSAPSLEAADRKAGQQ